VTSQNSQVNATVRGELYLLKCARSPYDTPFRFHYLLLALIFSIPYHLPGHPTILPFFERHLDTHFGFIFWIILSYDVTTNDTHDSNGRPLPRIAL
jgi:hypothetical protein